MPSTTDAFRTRYGSCRSAGSPPAVRYSVVVTARIDSWPLMRLVQKRSRSAASGKRQAIPTTAMSVSATAPAILVDTAVSVMLGRVLSGVGGGTSASGEHAALGALLGGGQLRGRGGSAAQMTCLRSHRGVSKEVDDRNRAL